MCAFLRSARATTRPYGSIDAVTPVSQCPLSNHRPFSTARIRVCLQMLGVGAAVAIPAVIRNVHQHLCSPPSRGLAHFVWKN